MNDIFFNLEGASASDINAELRRCAGQCGFARYSCAGHSVCSREIGALELGSLYRPALIIGGTHGTEWVSVFSALRLALELSRCASERTCEYGIDVRRALGRSGAVIIPQLNPDGYEIFKNGASGAARRAHSLDRFEYGDFRHWQSNARGIDINHNFSAGFYIARAAAAKFGITRRGPTRYGGILPFSQPETRTARRACERYRPRSLFSLHSQGEEIYWQYGERTHPSALSIAETLAALAGYTVTQPESIASHAGLKDWFIERYGLPAFTIELGLGCNPLPYSEFEEIYQKIRRMLFVASVL